MLFRMGQCLHMVFKQVREAEGYYRARVRGPSLHRRSLEKDDQLASPLLASRTPTATWRAVLTRVSTLPGVLLKNSNY